MEEINKKGRFPAPNSYKNTLQSLNKKGGKIAIKLPTEFDEIEKKKTPGPGEYNPQHLNLSDAGSFFLSKFKNTSSPRYHNPEH